MPQIKSHKTVEQIANNYEKSGSHTGYYLHKELQQK